MGKKYTIAELADVKDEELINSFIENTNADIVQLLMEINIIPGLTLYRWESLIKRINVNGSGVVEKLHVKLKHNKENRQYYSEGLLHFKNNNFQEALKFFNQKLRSLPIGSNEHAICLRWVALCLYELNYDDLQLIYWKRG